MCGRGEGMCVCVGGGVEGEKGTGGKTWYCTAYSRILSVLFKQSRQQRLKIDS